MCDLNWDTHGTAAALLSGHEGALPSFRSAPQQRLFQPSHIRAQGRGFAASHNAIIYSTLRSICLCGKSKKVCLGVEDSTHSFLYYIPRMTLHPRVGRQTHTPQQQMFSPGSGVAGAIAQGWSCDGGVAATPPPPSNIHGSRQRGCLRCLFDPGITYICFR